MLNRGLRGPVAGLVFGVAGLVSVAGAVPSSRPPSVARPAVSDGVLLRWGNGPGEVGLRAGGEEFPAAGVESVAVGPDGATWLLDRRNLRLVRLGASPVSFGIPADVVDVAIGADGTVAAFSQLRSTVFVYDIDGAALGELPVPRTFTEVAGVSVGPSRQVYVHTGYQETFLLGSPSVPQTEASVRASYREGVVFLPSGEGVAVVRSADGTASLRVTRMGDERAEEVRRVPFAKGVMAGVVVGSAGDVVCVKVEREVSAKPFRVGRSVTCVDARSGRVVLDEALPPRGLFLPTRELAVGGFPANVIHISAERDGLRVRSWPLSAGVAR